MVDYSVVAYQWAGFTTYNNEIPVTLSDDDANMDWLGEDTGTPQTITAGSSTYTIDGGGYLEAVFIDNETGDTVTENLLFYYVDTIGWVFTPPTGSSFTEGDTITGWGPNGWTDTDGVPYSEIVCFTPGCLIKTLFGNRPVECLKIGDTIQTADNGYQNIRWIGRSEVSKRQLLVQPHLRPILIRKDSFGPGTPSHDMRVSPQHRMLVAGNRLQLDFAEIQMLAPAKGLVNGSSVLVDQTCTEVSYIHLMFDRHEVLFSNDLPTESFHPGQVGLQAVGQAARQELFELFPDLELQPQSFGTTARACLNVGETRILPHRELAVSL